MNSSSPYRSAQHRSNVACDNNALAAGVTTNKRHSSRCARDIIAYGHRSPRSTKQLRVNSIKTRVTRASFASSTSYRVSTSYQQRQSANSKHQYQAWRRRRKSVAVARSVALRSISSMAAVM